MKYMLDTNICIYLINERPKSVLDKFRTFDIDDIAISSITVCELEYGIQKSNSRKETRLALIEFLLPFQVLEFNSKAAANYGIIRASLESNGMPIGSMDYLIAAHAISNNLILVTNNTREFSRVEGLKVENWV